jgi:hypothetical protein
MDEVELPIIIGIQLEGRLQALADAGPTPQPQIANRDSHVKLSAPLKFVSRAARDAASNQTIGQICCHRDVHEIGKNRWEHRPKRICDPVIADKESSIWQENLGIPFQSNAAIRLDYDVGPSKGFEGQLRRSGHAS